MRLKKVPFEARKRCPLKLQKGSPEAEKKVPLKAAEKRSPVRLKKAKRCPLRLLK